MEREISRKDREIIAQRHKTICINRYLTQPDDVYTDRYLAFHPIHTPDAVEKSDGVMVRMTNAGISLNIFSYANNLLFTVSYWELLVSFFI